MYHSDPYYRSQLYDNDDIHSTSEYFFALQRVNHHSKLLHSSRDKELHYDCFHFKQRHVEHNFRLSYIWLVATLSERRFLDESTKRSLSGERSADEQSVNRAKDICVVI